MRIGTSVPVLLGSALLLTVRDQPAALISTIILMVVALILIKTTRYQSRHENPTMVVRGFARDLLRMVENNPRNTSGSTRDARITLLQKSIDLGNQTRPRLPDRHMVQVHAPYSTLTIAGDGSRPSEDVPLPGMQPRELLALHEQFAGDFWGKAQGIRNGCLVLIHLLADHNPVGARNALSQHFAEGRSQPFSAMRRLLQTDAPSLGWMRRRQLTRLNPKEILSGLDYRPFDEDRIYVGTEILEGFRNYVR